MANGCKICGFRPLPPQLRTAVVREHFEGCPMLECNCGAHRVDDANAHMRGCPVYHWGREQARKVVTDTFAMLEGAARGDNREMMSLLAGLFPTLRGAPGVRPWDPVALDKHIAGPAGTSGSTCAASFVLHVWKGGNGRAVPVYDHDATEATDYPEGVLEWGIAWPFQVPPFDLARALSVMDDDHREVIRAWVEDPWWP